jgi:hypothetical protein
MTRITTMAAATALAMLASSPVFSQSSDGPMKPGDGMSSPHTGMGTTGDNGGSTQIDPVGNGPTSKYYQPPVATGLDLKGPTKTEGPFAE